MLSKLLVHIGMRHQHNLMPVTSRKSVCLRCGETLKT